MTDSSGYYTWHVGELRGGLITTSVPLVQTAWSTVMDDADVLSGTAVMTDPAVQRRNLYTSAEPARCFLAVAYTDPAGVETFLAGGPVWSHAYDGATKQLAIRASGLWSLWDHRFVLPVLAAGVNPATVSTSYSGLSLGTVAKRLVQLAQAHVGSDVPVVLPDDQAGSQAPTFNGYEMNLVGTILRNLTAADGGPEIQFVPRRQAANPRRLEWVMRVGTATRPLLTQDGADWTWDLGSARSNASGLSVTRDGSTIAQRSWAQGAGTDISTLFGRADDITLTDAGFPLLERLDSAHSDITAQTTLDGYAAAGLAQSKRPLETWTFTTQRDGNPTAGAYRVGDRARLKVPAAEYYLPAGDYRSRITSLSGDDTAQIKVSLAPTIGGT